MLTAKMNSLPYELIDHISSYLEREDLRNTLFLSPSFQVAAEKYSGAFDKFEVNEDNAARFLRIYSGRRLYFLKHVSFRTALPRLVEESADWETNMPLCRDTEEELREADECFTKQIQFLFSTIETLEARVDDKNGLGKIQLTIYTPTQTINPAQYCAHRLYVSWRIHLLKPELLPSLASICALRIENGMEYNPRYRREICSQRKIDLRIITDIASRLSNLGLLTCRIGADEWLAVHREAALRFATHDWAGPRRDSRQDFAQSLETTGTSLMFVRDAWLDFIAPLSGATTFDQREPFPNLIAPMLVDTFSTNLRHSLYRLRRLCLKAIVDHTLFWPSSDREATPFWPHLEVVIVSFQIMTPSGEWYFDSWKHDGSKQGFIIGQDAYPPAATVELPQDEEYHELIDDFEWDDTVYGQCRVLPNEQTLIPLLTSFAKAAAHMPRLKSAMLWAPLELGVWPEHEDEQEQLNDFGVEFAGPIWHDYIDKGSCEPLAWGMVYAAPGTRSFADHKSRCSDVRQIWWHVADWRPGRDLHQTFKEIGQDVHGPGLEEYWETERESGVKVGRDEFLEHEEWLFPQAFPYARPCSFDGRVPDWDD